MKPLLARDLMKKDLVTILANEAIDALAALLDEEGIHGVPVVDAEGQPVGVVGRTDIARAVAEQAEEGPARAPTRVATVEGSLDLEDFGPSRPEGETVEGRVADIMSDRIVQAPETATAGELARLMLKEGVHRVLITDRSRLVGLVSATDLLRCLAGYERALRRAPKGKPA